MAKKNVVSDISSSVLAVNAAAVLTAPLVYRSMKKADDELPVVEPSAKGLGVRVPNDIDVGSGGQVISNEKGMSVAPHWTRLPLFRIPARLHPKVEGARGPNHVFCFKCGAAPFVNSAVATGLTLRVTSNKHGTVAPVTNMPLTQYENHLSATRGQWVVDET